MYAIIKTGGKQYPVSVGDVLRVEKLDASEGDEITLNDVFLVSSPDSILIGSPQVPNASVRARILGHGKADKVVIMKKKRRTGYKVKRGHRQPYTTIEIQEVRA